MAAGKKTGGRAAGTPNKATAAKVAEVTASGLAPLDYMLSVMRDTERNPADRLDAAKAAAPYVHPKLATLTVGGDPDNPIHHRHELDAERFTRAIAGLVARNGDEGGAG